MTADAKTRRGTAKSAAKDVSSFVLRALLTPLASKKLAQFPAIVKPTATFTTVGEGVVVVVTGGVGVGVTVSDVMVAVFVLVTWCSS